jgi:fructosamine-3-kinase
MTVGDGSPTDRVEAAVDHPVDEVHAQLHDVPPHEVYEATVRGQRAICKIGTGPSAAPTREAWVLDHVRSETNLPVPSVLAAGENYFMARWLGEFPEDQELTQTWARTAGRTMARLHAQTSFEHTGVPRSGSDGFQSTVHDRWDETVKSLIRIRRDHLLAAGHEVDAGVADTALSTLPE